MRILKWLLDKIRGTPREEKVAGKKKKSGKTRNSGMISPDGMQVIASSSDNEEPEDHSKAVALYQPLTGLTVMFPKCGHLGPEKAMLNFWGHILDFSVGENTKNVSGQKTVNSDEVPCPRCFFEEEKIKSIRCALCGYGIIPGDGVAIYHKTSQIPHKELATMVGENYIGCLLWNCCPSGGFFAGHWTGEGFKPAFESGGSAVGEVMATGKPVFGNTEER